MRIDTCETALERGKQMAYMCDKIRKITSAEASNLPEQHFLVKEFSGWRHIDVVWNREVYPEQYVDHASVLQNVRVSHDWCTPRSCNKVRIFHFSGTWLAEEGQAVKKRKRGPTVPPSGLTCVCMSVSLHVPTYGCDCGSPLVVDCQRAARLHGQQWKYRSIPRFGICVS